MTCTNYYLCLNGKYFAGVLRLSNVWVLGTQNAIQFTSLTEALDYARGLDVDCSVVCHEVRETTPVGSVKEWFSRHVG